MSSARNSMKKTLLTLWIIATLPVAAFAQDRIYRCGNEYTNNATQAKERGCKLVEGGNVTVIQGSRPSGGGGAASGGADRKQVERSLKTWFLTGHTSFTVENRPRGGDENSADGGSNRLCR